MAVHINRYPVAHVNVYALLLAGCSFHENAFDWGGQAKVRVVNISSITTHGEICRKQWLSVTLTAGIPHLMKKYMLHNKGTGLGNKQNPMYLIREWDHTTGEAVFDNLHGKQMELISPCHLVRFLLIGRSVKWLIGIEWIQLWQRGMIVLCCENALPAFAGSDSAVICWCRNSILGSQSPLSDLWGDHTEQPGPYAWYEHQLGIKYCNTLDVMLQASRFLTPRGPLVRVHHMRTPGSYQSVSRCTRAIKTFVVSYSPGFLVRV